MSMTTKNQKNNSAEVTKASAPPGDGFFRMCTRSTQYFMMVSEGAVFGSIKKTSKKRVYMPMWQPPTLPIPSFHVQLVAHTVGSVVGNVCKNQLGGWYLLLQGDLGRNESEGRV